MQNKYKLRVVENVSYQSRLLRPFKLIKIYVGSDILKLAGYMLIVILNKEDI